VISDFLPDQVARLRVSIRTKLLWAFLAIVGLMVASGVAGLRALAEVNRRTDDLVQLQRKIAAYRQLNHDTVAQLYSVAQSLLKPEPRALEATLRQLNQFGYDLDRLQFVAQDEKEIFARLRVDYEEFIRIVSQVIEHIRSGHSIEGRELQLSGATPHTERLERLTNELVNKAESDMVISIEASNEAYLSSRRLVMVFIVASVLLALLLGYSISSSIIRPVQRMEARMREIASGNFNGELIVLNRDELGALAADLNRMSEQLGRAYSEIEAASRHKSEFLANMSHELRTPLNAIIGFSEVLKDGLLGALTEKQIEYAKDIFSSGHHLLSLINDILDLAKIEAGRMELAVSTFSVPETLENTLTLVRGRAARHGIQLDLEVDTRLGQFSGDERKFRQTLLNLLSNAVKFTPEQGQVRVTAVPVAEGIQVSVSDTGVGIPEAEQEAIFDAFHQVSGSFGAQTEGTGLGLTLAKQFVEMHGGRIWVKSELRKGSVFTFTLAEQRLPIAA
jgi:signal transduction histidine kinase